MASATQPLPAPLPPSADASTAPEPDTLGQNTLEPTAPTPPSTPRVEASPAAMFDADGRPIPAEGEAGDYAMPPISFFRQPWVQKSLPLATSLLLHLTIIIVGLTIFTVAPIITKAIKDQVIIPDSTIVNDAPVGGVVNPGLGTDPNRAAAQDKVETAETGLNNKKAESLTASLAGGGASDGAADNVIGLGAHSGLGAGGGVGAAVGAGTGAGTGDGGAMSPFGVPGGGGGLGPKSPFMGISGNAHTIAYVCDASGSMLVKMPQLKEQLRQTVSKLQPIQSFDVIFFADPDTKPVALAQNLIIANPTNKLNFEKYLADIRAAGSTDPVPGLQLAFRMHPQLIYLLTDGDFPDNQKVLDTIKTLQASSTPKVKIDTIVFEDPEKADKGIIALMKQLAQDSGGVYKAVSPNDL